ncbi:MAG: class I SAM-dependent methyltransferase, partial [Oscillospiraceae bacterium]|nr:class I SAM-dependent methyltransferase [Oscillospiraceae bacterium]
MDTIKIVKDYYDTDPALEWVRIDGRPEFILTCRYLDRYIKPGDKVLDIGGGPGRYSLYLAQKGCQVTLLDLSQANVDFAAAKAREKGLSLNPVCGEADACVSGLFDHVLLMGPLYHLLEEGDRVRAVDAALRLLRPGGVFFATFINLFAGMIFAMKEVPEAILDKKEDPFFSSVLANESFAGLGFTQAFMIQQDDVLPFMARFPLEKLHLFGQEGLTSPCEHNIMSQSPEVVAA